MASYSTQKNLLKSRDTYSRYYGDFRGVDFSSDHSQVHEQRLAYLVNMYKDYQSKQGKALETIAGFRRRVVLPEEAEIFGIHDFKQKDSNGNLVTKILLHAGNKLYLWHNYPNTINVVKKETITLQNGVENQNGTRSFTMQLGDNVVKIVSISKIDGEDITLNMDFYEKETRSLSITRSDLMDGDLLYVSFTEGVIETEDALFADMNARRSSSFVFNNRLYLIDGKNYLVYDGNTVSSVLASAYIPTTYINIIPSGENADIGTEYEQRNFLQPKFKHTFIADGATTEFYMNENALEAVIEVKVYGKTLTAEDDYTVDLPNGKITFAVAPKKPEEVEDGAYPEFYAGIEITAQKTFTSVSGVTEEKENIYELITDCTIVATFDNRVFVSGNPNYPNHVFYCGRNITGYVDPSYFGVLNYMQDGVGITPITGMIPVADTLMVLKGDTRQDGSTYFHTAVETNQNLKPKVYPSTQGLSGIGCLGACINFLDDPVFISRLGVEAIGQLSVRYERAVEHRSSLIDAMLVNMDLSDAVLEEWNGYLLVLVDGKIFMADSRQKYMHDIGVPQYEWYYLEDIGIYKNQYPEYRYSTQIYSEIEGKKVRFCTECKKGVKYCTCGNEEHLIELPIKLASSVYYHEIDETRNLAGEIVNPPDEYGKETNHVFDERVSFVVDDQSYETELFYTVHELCGSMGEFLRYEAFLCEEKGNKTGGIFQRATTLKSMESNLFFGTKNGVLCSFNFDMRTDQGEILPQYYAFDDRTIFCGCATKMDCCGIPHLSKNTVKKSTVIKTKSFSSSAAKIRVRTNRKPYESIARINSTLFSFGNTDFSDFSFITTEQSLFAIKEKEKKWVEKQYYLYSDEFMKPFALFYISFRYNVSGRYKE